MRSVSGVGRVAALGAIIAAVALLAIVLFGGFSRRDLNDVWTFDLDKEQWFERTPDGPLPPARYYGAPAAHDDELIIFGGRERSRPKVNYSDTWSFDRGSGRWKRVAPDAGEERYGADAISPAYHAKAACAVVDGGLYLWGGEGRRGHVSDLWRLEMATTQWELLQPARDDDPELW